MQRKFAVAKIGLQETRSLLNIPSDLAQLCSVFDNESQGEIFETHIRI